MSDCFYNILRNISERRSLTALHHSKMVLILFETQAGNQISFALAAESSERRSLSISKGRNMKLMLPFLALSSLLLGGCTYVTARPASDAGARGIPVYGVKSFVVVNSSGVSSVIVPDCAQKYLLSMGGVFAKNHTVVELTNGVIAKVDSDQDSSDSLPKLLDFAKSIAAPSAPKGQAMSAKADGGVEDEMAIYEVRCDGSNSSLVQQISKKDFVPVKSVRPNAFVPQLPTGALGGKPHVTSDKDDAAGSPMPGSDDTTQHR